MLPALDSGRHTARNRFARARYTHSENALIEELNSSCPARFLLFLKRGGSTNSSRPIGATPAAGGRVGRGSGTTCSVRGRSSFQDRISGR